MPTENRSSNTEMVSVQRELTQMAADAIDDLLADGTSAVSAAAWVDVSQQLRALLAQPAEQHQGESVAWVADVVMHNGEKIIDGNMAFMAAAEIGTKLYTHANPGEVEQLREENRVLQRQLGERWADVDELRAQLAELEALHGDELGLPKEGWPAHHKREMKSLRDLTTWFYERKLAERDALPTRALPYLSNTPDLVQHGAEDLAEEIRSASAGRPCYGPNEWGAECGKCKHASAEPSAPVKMEPLGQEFAQVLADNAYDLILKSSAPVEREEGTARIHCVGSPPDGATHYYVSYRKVEGKDHFWYDTFEKCWCSPKAALNAETAAIELGEALVPITGKEPIAPVERDERAEFEACIRREWPMAPISRKRDLLPKDDPCYGDYCDEPLQRAWVGWQMRAALERKP